MTPATRIPSLARTEGWAAAVLAVEVWRQQRFIDRHAVNILFWDQWDFFRPILSHKGWWAAFDYQWGPHRQGLGGVLLKVLSYLSGCDARCIAYAIGWLIVAAAGVAVAAAWRCGCRSPLALAAVPLPFFNLHQFEGFVGASNPSHGALPLLLLMLCALAWTVKNSAARAVSLVLLTMLLLFTGFGLFAGAAMPLLVITECARRCRERHWAAAAWALGAFVAIGAAWWWFARGYQWSPAVPNFHFPYQKPGDYFLFFALVLANFHGFGAYTGLSIGVGSAVAIGLVAVALVHLRRCWRDGAANAPASATLFLFSAFVLLYSANAAVGRVMLGLTAAPFASRYVTLIVPGSLALLGHLYLARGRGGRIAAGLYALLLIPATTVLHPAEYESIAWYSGGKAAWKAAYLATGSETQADQISHFRISPRSVTGELAQFRRERLNLYRPGP